MKLAALLAAWMLAVPARASAALAPAPASAPMLERLDAFLAKPPEAGLTELLNLAAVSPRTGAPPSAVWARMALTLLAEPSRIEALRERTAAPLRPTLDRLDAAARELPRLSASSPALAGLLREVHAVVGPFVTRGDFDLASAELDRVFNGGEAPGGLVVAELAPPVAERKVAARRAERESKREIASAVAAVRRATRLIESGHAEAVAEALSALNSHVRAHPYSPHAKRLAVDEPSFRQALASLYGAGVAEPASLLRAALDRLVPSEVVANRRQVAINNVALCFLLAPLGAALVGFALAGSQKELGAFLMVVGLLSFFVLGSVGDDVIRRTPHGDMYELAGEDKRRLARYLEPYRFVERAGELKDAALRKYAALAASASAGSKAPKADSFEAGIAGLLGGKDPDVRASALGVLEDVVTAELLGAGRADNPSARAALAAHVRLLEQALPGKGAGDVRLHLRELARARLMPNGAGTDDPFLAVLENYLDALQHERITPHPRPLPSGEGPI